MFDFFILIAVAVLFYVIIPGLGAIQVRRQWRNFRYTLVESSLFPLLDLAPHSKNPGDKIRFFGYLEAIEEDSIIWVRKDKNAIAVDMSSASIYFLPSGDLLEDQEVLENNKENIIDEMPVRIEWRRISSLPEGSKIYVSGTVFVENGRELLKPAEDTPLLVIFYDAAEESFFRRSIWGGRQKNEYWNYLTPVSLVAGFFSLLILSSIFVQNPLARQLFIVSLVFCILPLLTVLPPGGMFYLVYRRLWKEGRLFRAERDLFAFSLRYFDDNMEESCDRAETILPNGERYVMRPLVQDRKILPLETGFHFRSTRIIAQESMTCDHIYVFGKPQVRNSVEWFVKPKDPMAEYLLIPCQPMRLTALVRSRARRLERISLFFLLTGVVINSLAAYWVFGLLIR
ncbi:MAG: hypothetical protein ACLFR1_04480 [Spirochaetia bacterium]